MQNANNRVQVKVSGAGRLLGLDNGDSTDYDPYKGLSRRLFSGKLMAIIGSTQEAGTIQIEVTSAGLQGETASFESKAADEGRESITASVNREGRGSRVQTDAAPVRNHQQPVFMKNEERPVLTGGAQEIPLRKIEIISESGQALDPSTPELIVTAKLYPENTSYRDIEWSAVNDAGIVSNIAKVQAVDALPGEGTGARSINEHQHIVKIGAMGDGTFRLRLCQQKWYRQNQTDLPAGI